MDNGLDALIRAGVPVASIVDIGIAGATRPLMRTFPKLTHYLFEPVDSYFDVIRNNYASIRHELFHLALSDTDGDAWQVGRSIDGSDRVTHSRVSDKPVGKSDDSRVVECKPVRQTRLDTFLSEHPVPTPFLLKIDVDGHEIPILNGAADSLLNASIVVIEAPLSALIERAVHLAERGFVLYDIVEPSYYRDRLWQVDLIFLRSDLFKDYPQLDINPELDFQWQDYRSINERYWSIHMRPTGPRPLWRKVLDRLCCP